MNKIYVRDSFMDAYNGLPEMFRGNIRDALIEFHSSKLMKSRRPEKLPAYADMYSLRVDRRYRILMSKIDGAAYVLLLVGPHDVTYDWAEKNKKSVSSMSTDPSDYILLEDAMPEWFVSNEPENDNDSEQLPVQETEGKKLFGNIRDRKLLKGLSGPEELEIIRTWYSAEDFEAQKDTLSPSSVVFLRFLIDGMSVEEALHEMNLRKQNHEEHQAFEREMENIRKTFRNTYNNSNFPHISGDNGKYCLLAGTFGSGKTAELIGSINHADEYISKRDRILFLVSNPDYLSDMRSYLQIVGDPKQMKRVDVLDYTGLMKHLMDDCGKRWGYDFRVAEINDDDDLLDILNRKSIVAMLNIRLKPNDIYSILMVDLDGFKTINENYGHSVSDNILIYIANELKKMENNYHWRLKPGSLTGELAQAIFETTRRYGRLNWESDFVKLTFAERLS